MRGGRSLPSEHPEPRLGTVGSYFFRRDVRDFARDVAMEVISAARVRTGLGSDRGGTFVEGRDLQEACLRFCTTGQRVSRRRLAALRATFELGGPGAVFDLVGW